MEASMAIAFLLFFAMFFEFLNFTSAYEANYVVNTPNCRIPDFDPYDKSLAGLISKWPSLKCGTLPPLTKITRHYIDPHRKRFSHTLHLQRHNFGHYNLLPSQSRCCYKKITRITTKMQGKTNFPDDGYELGGCIYFSKDVTFYDSEEFIWVKCERRVVTTNDVPPYVNMHAFIGNKIKVRRKIDAQKKKRRKLSVMILGMDSMSRLNMLRTMPETVNHLEKFGWYNMKGFNKMGDNTFPNIMATLTGTRVSPSDYSCGLTKFLDDCPLIWKAFADEDYITAYGEDTPLISSFNYLKYGFFTTPTDYYMRPFLLAATGNTAHTHLKNRDACYGPTRVTDHILSYALDFSASFTNYSTFSLFWLNNFSHDDVNIASAFDSTMSSFLRKLSRSKVMNTTMIFFLSDHGQRFGKIRETFVGYLEDRLPLLYVWVPESLKKAYPAKIKNLARNGNKLTSHFDVYLTMVEVLRKNFTAPGCPKCTSLFGTVPWNRTCIDAGILDHWCACAEYTEIPTKHPLSGRMAQLVLDHINQLLMLYKRYVTKGFQCARLQLHTVISLNKKLPANLHQGIQQITIVLRATPGMGIFEATVSGEGSLNVMDGISRLNEYGSQSSCVQHHEARKYCYCQRS